MTGRAIFAMSLVSWMLLACGSESPVASPEVESAPAAAAPIDVSGMYSVKGTTVVTSTGDERNISGTVILRQDGTAYTSTFNLETMYPGEDGPLSAKIIGTGEGTVEGTTATGSAETQLVMAAVTGMDTAFAFAPRIVGPRLSSESVAVINADGSIEVTIENAPAEGEENYLATKTTLRGTRVSESAESP